MSDIKARLSIREKAGYGLGDAAANFIFQTIIILQLAFYTDTFGISAAAAGTLFLIVRFSDAFTDPLMGIIADRSNSRWGKFRPWILWSAVPFGVLAFLTFTTPDFGPTGKLVWAYVTYTLLMMIYTVNNLPYSALSGVMTADPGERTSLSQYRFVFAMIAAFVVQALALPLVAYFGQGDDQRGYQVTMGIFAMVAVLCFVVTFFSTKERVKPDPNQQSSIRQDFADLLRNGPWIAMFFLTLFVFITLALRGGVMLYYFRYYLSDESLIAFTQNLPAFLGFFVRLASGEPVAVTFSLFNACGLLATIVGILFAKPLAVRYGKRNVFIAGLTLTAVFTAAFYWLPPDRLQLVFGTEILRQFVYGFTIPLLWAMMADVADYSEWQNRRRATGIVFSAVVFGLKGGLGIGGAIGGWLLAYYNYVPKVEQSAETLQGIVLIASLYSAATFLIGAACLLFYKIDREMEIRISDELDRRRDTFEDPLAVAP